MDSDWDSDDVPYGYNLRYPEEISSSSKADAKRGKAKEPRPEVDSHDSGDINHPGSLYSEDQSMLSKTSTLGSLLEVFHKGKKIAGSSKSGLKQDEEPGESSFSEMVYHQFKVPGDETLLARLDPHKFIKAHRQACAERQARDAMKAMRIAEQGSDASITTSDLSAEIARNRNNPFWPFKPEGIKLTEIMQFITHKGHEYYCEVDEDYMTDRFNLTGLQQEVEHYQYALDLITDVSDLECSDELREQIEDSARKLYGLVHARYITTTRGLQKMLEKFKKGDFGRCPRVMCNSTRLLPCGLSDNPGVQKVKLYCAGCEDMYRPKSSKHSEIDGAHFGTTFHNMLFQIYPSYAPPKSVARYEPRVFGFKMHAAATLNRWQEQNRQKVVARCKERGEPNPYVDDEENDDGMDLNEGEEDDNQEL